MNRLRHNVMQYMFVYFLKTRCRRSSQFDTHEVSGYLKKLVCIAPSKLVLCACVKKTQPIHRGPPCTVDPQNQLENISLSTLLRSFLSNWPGKDTTLICGNEGKGSFPLIRCLKIFLTADKGLTVREANDKNHYAEMNNTTDSKGVDSQNHNSCSLTQSTNPVSCTTCNT